jgi:hypothetical protein
VRNTAPQRTAAPVDESLPLSYPRLARADPGGQVTTADRLLVELLDLHTAMRYEAAEEVADRLVELTPQQPLAHYNRACVMGRLRRSEEALSSLEQAVNCGWRDLVHLSLDPDLDSIRDTARYAKLTRRLRRLLADDVQAPPGLADDMHRRAPAILRDLGVPAATIALVADGRVSWVTSIASSRAELPSTSGDEPTEVSSAVRLLALAALLDQSPPADLAPGRGPVVRRAGYPPRPPRAASESELIEDVERATGRPFAPYCRARILEPLRMERTRLGDAPDASAPAVYSTAGDLGRLVASLCPPPGLEPGGLDRLVELGTRLGLNETAGPGTATGLELAHRSESGAVLLRWYPRRGQGLVIVTRGGDAMPAARRIARLAFPGR